MPNINAVLVNLSIKTFANSRKDPDLTAEVQNKHKLSADAGKWLKVKLPEQALKPIKQYATIVRTYHYAHTLMWDEGYRLVTHAGRQSYEKAMCEFETGFQEHVAEFMAQYPKWIEQSKIMHGKTWNPCDYPEPEAMREQFKIAFQFLPIPESQHFNTEMRSLYGAALEQHNQERIQEAVKETWQRVLDPVRSMADKLSSKDAIFRDSLVDNIREIVQLVPTLNLTNDATMRQAAQVIQDQLATLNPDTLRENKVMRKEAAEKAANIVKRFGALGHRKFAEAA